MKKRKHRQHKEHLLLYNLLDVARMFFITIIIVFFVFQFGFRNKEIKGSSMHPTLVDEERVIINVAASYVTAFERFDIVVTHSPDNDDLWIKRIIGMPYETIEFYEDTLYVNNQPVEQPFLDEDYMENIKEKNDFRNFTQNYGPITLGKGEYLLVGDNRNASLDSRNPKVGPFQRDKIIAKGVLRYSPWDKVRYIVNGK